MKVGILQPFWRFCLLSAYLSMKNVTDVVSSGTAAIMSAFFVSFFVYFLFKKYIPTKTVLKMKDDQDQNGLDQLSMDADDDEKYLADENGVCDHCEANGHHGVHEDNEEEEEEEEEEQNQSISKKAQVGIREVTVEKVERPMLGDRAYSEEEKLLAKQRITKIIGKKVIS